MARAVRPPRIGGRGSVWKGETGRQDSDRAVTDAAVVIPHYNDNARLDRCLAALMPQVAAMPGTEVVVIDNGSDRHPGALAARWPGLRILDEAQKGAAHARNRGVAETRAARIFFLDCDCVPEPDWLATACRVAPRADLVGGTVTVFDETPPPRSGAEAFETVFAFDNRGYIERKGFSVTANLLVTRAAFEATGGFRHGMSEDLDWCRRATAAGFALVHEDALRVAHPTRSDWPALARKWRRLTEEGWGLTDGGPAARAGWALRALAMIPSIALHAPRVLRHPALTGPEKRAGLATLARLRLARCGWMLRQSVSARPGG